LLAVHVIGIFNTSYPFDEIPSNLEVIADCHCVQSTAAPLPYIVGKRGGNGLRDYFGINNICNSEPELLNNNGERTDVGNAPIDIVLGLLYCRLTGKGLRAMEGCPTRVSIKTKGS